jgi:NAD(P)-dependent dehydrogenase (short-subunit alcohol dehydrogenase family)
MKILLTRVRPESLSGKIEELLIDYTRKHIIICEMPEMWDITDLDTYPMDLCEYDVIINTSGVTYNESIQQHTIDNARHMFDVNVIGAMNLTSEYAKQREKNGLIIHIGSIGARKVFTNCSGYCASKAALAHYIQCAGYELKTNNISVIGIHPGNIKDTRMTNKVRSDLELNRGMTRQQVEDIYKSAQDPYDIASFIISFLDMPCKNITGENFYLGDGWKG